MRAASCRCKPLQTLSSFSSIGGSFVEDYSFVIAAFSLAVEYVDGIQGPLGFAMKAFAKPSNALTLVQSPPFVI